MKLKKLKVIAPKTHTRIACMRCKRKRDRGFISKLGICRVCFRQIAPRLGFRKW